MADKVTTTTLLSASTSSSSSDSTSGDGTKSALLNHVAGDFVEGDQSSVVVAPIATPPSQPRPEQPPPRVGRRERRRRHGVHRPTTSVSHVRLFQTIQQEHNNQTTITNEDAITDTDASTSQPTNTITNTNPANTQLQPQPHTHQTYRTIASSNSAVRVLFRDNQQSQPQQQQSQQHLLINDLASNHQSELETGTRRNYRNQRNYLADRQLNTNRQPISIIEANRRLIERQMVAIREADSRRWNFDFGNCRPLNQIGHRYVDCTATSDNLTENNNNDMSIANQNTANDTAGANSSAANDNAASATQLRNIKPLNDNNQTQYQ